MSNQDPINIALLGLGRMSASHLRAIREIARLRIVAGCDASPENLAKADLGDQAGRYATMDAMLKAARPDIVCIITPNSVHAANTCQLARHADAPRAILCEKPMSLTYGDAIEMVDTCESAQIELLINHQRRLAAVAEGRRLIESGAIGELLEIDVRCAGDFMSDGTHAVNAALGLGGDAEVRSVFGAIDRPEDTADRYGHPVERSAYATWFDAANVRYTVSTGALTQRTEYQAWRVRGTAGELWHPGGKQQPNWFLNNGQPGDHRVELNPDKWFSSPVEAAGGPWQRIAGTQNAPEMVRSLQLLIAKLDGDPTPHPLNGRAALPTQAIVNAVYLSALERQKIGLPLAPGSAFPIHELIQPGTHQ